MEMPYFEHGETQRERRIGEVDILALTAVRVALGRNW